MGDSPYLPSRYKYSQIGPGKYRSNLLNENDAKQWMEEYVSLTNTNWRVLKTKSNTSHYICSLEYNCHHSSYRRVDPNVNAKGKSKNFGCSAKLKIAIKHTTKDTRKKDKYVKEGMPAIITVTNNHNHSLTSGESLGYLRPTSKVRDEFDAYFDSGLGITESIQCNLSKLELKYGVGSVELTNALLNPKYRTVSFWYTKWRHQHLGTQHREGVSGIQTNSLDIYLVTSESRTSIPILDVPQITIIPNLFFQIKAVFYLDMDFLHNLTIDIYKLNEMTST